MKEIAICVIAYNRVDTLRRLLTSLEKAYYPHHNVPLIISIDKSPTNEVEDFAKNYQWKYGTFEVITHEKNLGLRQHVMSCGDLLEKYDNLIILEDDIFVAPNFYNYAQACVERYADDTEIAGISLYNFRYYAEAHLPFHQLKTDSDVYKMQLAQSWGEVWMKKQWQEFKKWYDNAGDLSIYGDIPANILAWPESSWLKYHTAYCVANKKYFIYPYVALSTCFAEAGTHTTATSSIHQSFLFSGIKTEYNFNPSVSYDSFREFEGFGAYLGIEEDELCTDYFGFKNNSQNRRYLLTRKKLPYKCIRSYGLELHPYELNVIMGIEGNMLFLYDTSVKEKNVPDTGTSFDFDIYNYNRRVDLNWVFKSSLKKRIKKILRR